MSPAPSQRLCKTQQTCTTLVKSIAKSQPLSKRPHRPRDKKIKELKYDLINIFKLFFPFYPWDVQNLCRHIYVRSWDADWASCRILVGTPRLVGRASGASSAEGKCDRPKSADPRQPGRVCLFGQSCTAATLWVRPCCPCCPAGQCRRNRVCYCNRPHPIGRSSSSPTSWCNLCRNYEASLREDESLQQHRSCPETNTWSNTVWR